MNLEDWLNEQVEHREDPFSVSVMVPRYERLAFLIGCNGGRLQVSGWGIISYRGGPFRQGLHQDEAFELMHYASFLDGVSFVAGDISLVLEPLLKSYFQHRQKAYESDMSARV